MTHNLRRGLLAVAVALSAAPAAGQGYGPQLGYQPPMAQPGPGQPSFYGQAPYGQPGPQGQQGAAPVPGGPSLVGTWTGGSQRAEGFVQQSDAYSPDGKFASVARLPNGFLGRVWGTYRVTPVGANQLRLDVQAQGWLPQEVCHQVGQNQPQCQPFQLPATDTSLVTFLSPDSIQSSSQTTPGPALSATRDPQPALLQAQAPQRWLFREVLADPVPSPIPRPYPIPDPYVPRRPACDDLQQRRICNINDGRLVPSNGCLVCVTN